MLKINQDKTDYIIFACVLLFAAFFLAIGAAAIWLHMLPAITSILGKLACAGFGLVVATLAVVSFGGAVEGALQVIRNDKSQHKDS